MPPVCVSVCVCVSFVVVFFLMLNSIVSVGRLCYVFACSLANYYSYLSHVGYALCVCLSFPDIPRGVRGRSYACDPVTFRFPTPSLFSTTTGVLVLVFFSFLLCSSATFKDATS